MQHYVLHRSYVLYRYKYSNLYQKEFRMEKKYCVGRKQRLNYLYESWLCGKTAYNVQRDKYLTVHLWLSNLGKLLRLKITY